MEEKKKAPKVIDISQTAKETRDEDMVVKFSHSYSFEGKIIDEVDLSGMDDLSATDMIKANKVLNQSGNGSVLPEMSLEYALVIASFSSDMPSEFFKALKPKDAIKVKNKVIAFFYGED